MLLFLFFTCNVFFPNVADLIGFLLLTKSLNKDVFRIKYFKCLKNGGQASEERC